MGHDSCRCKLFGQHYTNELLRMTVQIAVEDTKIATAVEKVHTLKTRPLRSSYSVTIKSATTQKYGAVHENIVT